MVKKILISGAGVAGLTLAFWLKKHGFIPTLVEKSSSLRIGGYKIDIRGTALEVIRRMNLYESIFESRTDIQGATYVDQKGQVLTTMSGDLYGSRMTGDLEIMRGDLCQILFNQLDVECLFGNSVRNCEEKAGGVWVEFEKGKERTFDLVVGADGLHSNIRRLAFGPEEKFLHNLGIYLSVFSIPNFLKLDRWEIECKEGTRLVNVYTTKEAKACFAFYDKSLEMPRTVESQRAILEKTFRNFGWETPRLLDEMNHSSDFYFDQSAQVKCPAWHHGRIVLLGDAGYAPSPMSGQGTSVALIGAYVLAQELSQSEYSQAFSDYNRRMRSFVLQNQKLAEFGVSIMKGSTMSRFIDCIASLLPDKAIRILLNMRLKHIAKVANSISLENRSKV